MATTVKSITVNLVSHAVAKFLHQMKELSPEATVILFRSLVMSENINPSSDVGAELAACGLLTPYGKLHPAVHHASQEYAKVLIAESGAALSPQFEPTTMKKLGHRHTPRGCKESFEAREARNLMERTAYGLNPVVLEALRASHLLGGTSAEEDMLLFMLEQQELERKPFYFPVSYDYRGRMYYRGGLLNPQGNDLNKGLLHYYVAAPLAERGFESLCYALADSLGYKGTRGGTQEWLEEATAGFRDDLSDVQPSFGYQALGLIAEYKAALDWQAAGNSIETFQSHAICHQDATCSGAQYAAAVTGDRNIAVLTNCSTVGNHELRGDLYGAVADSLAASGTRLGDFAKAYGRKMMKQCVMTLGYGAGVTNRVINLAEWLKEQGEDVDDLTEVTDYGVRFEPASQKAYEAALMEHCAPMTAVANHLEKAAAAAFDKGDAFRWATTDGFVAHQDRQEGDEVSVGAFTMTFNAERDKDAQVRASSPNVVHSMDATTMRMAIKELGHGTAVTAIHDSLGTRACDYRRAAVAVRRSFVRTNPRGTVETILNEHGVRTDKLVSGDYVASEVMKSAYFWC